MQQSLVIPSVAQIIVPNTIALIKGWLPRTVADIHGSAIIDETFNRWQGQLKYGRKGRFFDRGHTMSRFGDSGITYSFKGKSKPMYPMTPGLAAAREQVEKTLSWRANCVVVNSYAPGSGLYPHRDGKYIPQLGVDPIIVAVSFGATRTFDFHPWNDAEEKYDKAQPVISFPLSHGDMVIMHGKCDTMFKHGIPEEPNVVGTRVSLTFRQHLS